MTDKLDNQPVAKPATPAKSILTTSGATLFIMGVMQLLIPPEDIKNWQFLSPFVGTAVAFLAQYATAWAVTYTPDEIRELEKLKKDKKNLKTEIKEAISEPELYSETHIQNLKKMLNETSIKLGTFGQK